ncbi:uncharacterized protein CG31750 [Drosophila obscura]|uniref:uncharacterized protein CG31750 n=1 Tax=Drosophila obscura TaxID=7282 RepID=UPI001BB13641|nr:uncharacterized protein CG31750 [Drosophila obscura]
MPGEGHWGRSAKWQTRLLRWTVLGIGWTLYLFCRGCVIGQMKYDPARGQMIIRARGLLAKRIALLIKLAVLLSDYFGAFYILGAILPLLPEIDDHKRNGRRIFESLVTLVGMVLAYWNIGLLLYWLSSLRYNRSIVRVVNEVIRLHALIDRCFGPLLVAELHILVVFVAELHMTVLHLFNCLRIEMFLFLYNIVLLEVFFCAYMAYQMLLLSWLSSFSLFLHRYRLQGTSARGQRTKLLRLFRLYARVSNGHQAIMQLWLPVASMLFSSIVIMVVDCATIVNCILFKHNLDMRQKWDEIFSHLGACLSPLLRMLLLGLCNDSLTRLENLLSLQLLGTDLGHHQLEGDYRKDSEQEGFVRHLRNLQICFDLQTRAQPIRNHIMSVNQICGCPFFLDFFFCTLINSFSCVQYVLSLGPQSENFQGFFSS